ncbi:MAG: hypothetical protein MRY83_17980 [Flavobacteriales bacterium]|nr:hypothetical protein [Flavobacteriales bacterium]
MHPFYRKKLDIEKRMIRIEEHLKHEIRDAQISDFLHLIPVESIPNLNLTSGTSSVSKTSSYTDLILDIIMTSSNLFSKIQMLLPNNSEENEP